MLFTKQTQLIELRTQTEQTAKETKAKASLTATLTMDILTECQEGWETNSETFETKALYRKAYLAEYYSNIDIEKGSELNMYSKIEFILSNGNFKDVDILEYSDIAKFIKLERYTSNSKINKCKTPKDISALLAKAKVSYETSLLKLNKKVVSTMETMSQAEINKIIEVAKVMAQRAKAKEDKIEKARKKLSKAEYKVWLAEYELSEAQSA